MLFVEPEVDCFRLHLRDLCIPAAVLAQQPNTVAAAAAAAADAAAVQSPPQSTRSTAEPQLRHTTFPAPVADQCDEKQRRSSPHVLSPASPSPLIQSNRASATVSASTRASTTSTTNKFPSSALPHITLDERADALHRALLSALQSRFPYELPDTLEHAYVLAVTHCTQAPSLAPDVPLTAEDVACLGSSHDFLPAELRCRTFPSHLNAVLDPVWTAATAATTTKSAPPPSMEEQEQQQQAQQDPQRPSIRVTATGVEEKPQDVAAPPQARTAPAPAAAAAVPTPPNLLPAPRFFDSFFLLARDLAPAQQLRYAETQCSGMGGGGEQAASPLPSSSSSSSSLKGRVSTSGTLSDGAMASFSVLDGHLTHFVPACTTAVSSYVGGGSSAAPSSAAALANATQRIRRQSTRSGQSETFVIQPDASAAAKATTTTTTAAAAAPSGLDAASDARALQFSVYRIPLTHFSIDEQHYVTRQREELRWRQRRRWHVHANHNSECCCDSASSSGDEEADDAAASCTRRQHFDDVIGDLFHNEASAPTGEAWDSSSRLSLPPQQRAATQFFETCHKVLTNYAVAHSAVIADEATTAATQRQRQRALTFEGVSYTGVTRLLYSLAPCDCYHLVMKDNNPLYFACSSRASYEPQTVPLSLISDLTDEPLSTAAAAAAAASVGRRTAATSGHQSQQQQRETVLRATVAGASARATGTAAEQAGRPSPAPAVGGKVLWLPQSTADPNTAVPSSQESGGGQQQQQQQQQRENPRRTEDGLVRSRQPSPDRDGAGGGSRRTSATFQRGGNSANAAAAGVFPGTEGVLRVTASLVSNSISGNPRRSRETLLQKGAQVPAFLLPDAARREGAFADPSATAASSTSSSSEGGAAAAANLFRALADSSLAQHELRTGSIRSVVSVAVLHSSANHHSRLSPDVDGTRSCASSAVTPVQTSTRYCCRGLVDHTWMSLPVQHTPAEQEAIQWMPVLLGSTAYVSDVGLRTAVHLGIFPSPTADGGAHGRVGSAAHVTSEGRNRVDGSAAETGWPTREGALASLAPSATSRAQESSSGEAKEAAKVSLTAQPLRQRAENGADVLGSIATAAPPPAPVMPLLKIPQQQQQQQQQQTAYAKENALTSSTSPPAAGHASTASPTYRTAAATEKFQPEPLPPPPDTRPSSPRLSHEVLEASSSSAGVRSSCCSARSSFPPTTAQKDKQRLQQQRQQQQNVEDVVIDLDNEEDPQRAASPQHLVTTRGGVAMTFTIDPLLTGASRTMHAAPATASARTSAAAAAKKGDAVLMSARRTALHGRKAIGWADASPLPASAATPLHSPRHFTNKHHPVPSTTAAASTRSTSWTALSSNRLRRQWERGEGWQSTGVDSERGEGDNNAEAEEFVSSSVDRDHSNEEEEEEEIRRRRADRRRSDTPLRRPPRSTMDVPNPFSAYAQGLSATTTCAGRQTPPPPHSPRLPACFSAFATASSVAAAAGRSSEAGREEQPQEQFFDNPLLSVTAAALSPRTPAPRRAVQLTESCRSPRNEEAASRRFDRLSPLPTRFPEQVGAAADADTPLNAFTSLSALSRSSQDFSHSGYEATAQQGVATREVPRGPSHYFEQVWGARRTQHVAAAATTTTTAAASAVASSSSTTAPQPYAPPPPAAQQQRPSFFHADFGRAAFVLGSATNATTSAPALPPFAPPRTPQRATLHSGRLSTYSPPTRLDVHALGRATGTAAGSAARSPRHELFIDEYDDTVVRQTTAGGHEGDVRSRVRPRGTGATDPSWWQPVRELTSAPNLRFSSAWRPPFSTTMTTTTATNRSRAVERDSTLCGRLSESTDQPYCADACDGYEGDSPPLLRREAYRIPAHEPAPYSKANTQAVWPPSRRTEGCRTTELRGAACRLSLGGPFAPSNYPPQDAPPYAPEAPPSPPHARWQELSSVSSPPRPITRFGTSLTQSILGRRPPLAPQRGSRLSGYVSPHRYASRTSAFRPYSVAAGGAEEERRRRQQQRQRKLDSYQHDLQENYLCGPMPKCFCFEKPPLHPVEATAAPLSSAAAGRSASNGVMSAAAAAYGPRTTAVPSCVSARPAASAAKRTVLLAAVNTPLSEAARAYSLGFHPSSYTSTATGAGSSEVPPLLRASNVLGSSGAAGGATTDAEARAREQATREACMDARRQVETLADGDAARHLSSGVNVSFTLRDIAAVLLRLPLAKDNASGGLEVLDICSAAWRTAGASCFVSRMPTKLQSGWERYLERINVNQKPFSLRTQAIVLVLPVPHVPELKVCVAIHNIHDVLALVCQEPLPRLLPSAEEAWRREDRFDLGGEQVPTATGNEAQRATGAATETIEERRWLFGLFTTRRIVRNERSSAESSTSEQRHPSSPSLPTAADRSGGAGGDTAGRKQTPAVQRQKQMDALCLTWRHRLRVWYALFQAGRSCESLPACTSPLLTDPDACRARCALLCNRIAAYATVRHRLETLTAIRHAYEEHRAEALLRQRVRKLCDTPLFSGPTLRLGEAGERHGLRGGNAEAKGTAATNSTVEEGQRTRMAPGGVAFTVESPLSSTWAALHGAQPPSTSSAFSSRPTTTTVSPHTYCGQGGPKDVGNAVGSRAAASTRFGAPLSSASLPPRVPSFSAAAAVNAGQPVQPHIFTGTASTVAPYASGSSLAPVRAATTEHQQQQSQQPTDALSLARATADSGSTATARLALRAAGAGAGGVGASSSGMDVLLHLDRDDTLSSTLRRLATVCTHAAVPLPLTAVLTAAPRPAHPVQGVREDAEASTGVLGSNATSDEATPFFAGFVSSTVEVQPRPSQPFDISINQVQQLLQWQWEHHQHSYSLLPIPFFRGSVVPSVDFALFSAAREQASSTAYVSSSSATATAAAAAASPYAVSPLARELLVHLARWGWLLPLGVHRSNRRRGNQFSQTQILLGSRRLTWWRISFLLVGLAVAVERPGQCLCVLLGMGAMLFAYNGCCTGLLKPLPTHRSSTSAVVDGSSEVEWRPRLFLLCGPRIRLRRLWGKTAQRQAPRTGCRRCASCPPSLINHDVPPLQQRVSLLYSLSEATSIDQQERRAVQSSTQAVVALALRWQTCAAAVVSRVQLALCGYSTTLSFYIAGLCLAYLLLYLAYCAVVQRVGRCVASVFAESWSAERSVLSILLDTTADLLRQGLVNTYAFSRGGDGGKGGRWSAPAAQQTPAAALWNMSEVVWRDVFESVRFLLLQRLQRATADAADDHVDSADASGADDVSPERVNDGAGSASGRPSYFYQNGRYYAYDAEPPAWAQAGTLASSAPSGAAFAVPATTTSSSGSSSSGSAAAPTFTSASARLVHSLGDWVAQVVRGAGGEGGEDEFPLPPTPVSAGSAMHAPQQQQQSHAASSPPVTTAAVSPTPPTTNASYSRIPPLDRSPLWASNSCEPNILWFIVVAFVVTACLPRSPFRWWWRRVWVVLTHDDALARRPLLTV